MRSGFERTIAKLFIRRGITFEYESDSFPYTIQRTYTPDFKIQKKDGSSMFVETKGVFTSGDRTKMLLVKKQHPELDIRLWFMKDNYLSNKTKKKTYMQWAKSKGFKCHVGDTFPKEWLNECKK